jgi:hypothetical protein
MSIDVAKKLFTVDEYYQMAEAGILGPEDRVELIDGEIIQMSPIGFRHAGCVSRAHRLCVTSFGARAVVSSQNPLQLTNYTEPEPDLAVLKPRADDYTSKKVMADDALLVVEVSLKSRAPGDPGLNPLTHGQHNTNTATPSGPIPHAIH